MDDQYEKLKPAQSRIRKIHRNFDFPNKSADTTCKHYNHGGHVQSLKYILVVGALGLSPLACLAEDSLQGAVLTKVSADHAKEMGSGDFSRRQTSSNSQASRNQMMAKNSAPAGAKNPGLAKSPQHEKREIIKRRKSTSVR